VPEELRTAEAMERLPLVQRRRATHVYGEMQRVLHGSEAWQNGDWPLFGSLMNESCLSSINSYESGSHWLINLHCMASDINGVHGARFSGGGYGGCLFMLVDANRVDEIRDALLKRYLGKYPELASVASLSVAHSEGAVRVVSS